VSVSVSLGFFDDIIIPPDALQHPSRLYPFAWRSLYRREAVLSQTDLARFNTDCCPKQIIHNLSKICIKIGNVHFYTLRCQ